MLSPKHIKLHNFRGVVTLNWQFHEQPGLYFVQGQNLKEPTLGANGAGKSTIFVDAPYWVLTGKTIMTQRPGSSIESWGTERQRTSGELTLVVGSNEYVIVRGRNPSVLTINDRTVEQNEIDKLIPLSDSALRRTLLLGQRSLMFLDLRPEEKSRLFSETLDLDIWLQAADLASQILRERERDLSRLEAQSAGVFASITEIRDQHEASIKKEEEFKQQQEIRLQDMRVLVAEEIRRFDILTDALTDAQERQKQSAQSSTSDDDIRTQRAAERSLRDALIRLENDQVQRTTRRRELQHQLESYTNDTCPECGQLLLNPEHAQRRRQELMAGVEEMSQLLDEGTRVQQELTNKIIDSTEITLTLEAADRTQRDLRLSIKSLEDQSNTQQRTVTRIVNDMRKIENETNPFTHLCDELEGRFLALNDQRNLLDQQEQNLNEEIEILKFWQKGYRDIRLEQIDSTLLELELATNRNAAALGLQDWEIQFTTERETKAGTVSHAFSILLFPPGQNKPVPWESYSGGEAQRWQLAVTFALSEILLTRAGIQPDFEILDEITNHLSDVGIDDLLECLHSRAHELQRRIYLIDHRVLSKGDFDGIISVIKTSEGIGIENGLVN